MTTMDMPPSPQYSPASKASDHPHSKRTVMAQQLLTPEEPLIESFTSTNTAATTLPPLRAAIEPSTPVSPAFRAFASISEAGFSQHDEALYPDHNTVEAVEKPLFPTDHATQRDSLTPEPVDSAPPPTHKSSPVTSPLKMLETYGYQYWVRCMGEIEWMRDVKRRELPPLQQCKSQKRDTFTRQQLSKLDAVRGQARVQKTKPSAKVAITRPKAGAAPAPATPAALPETTPAKRVRRKAAASPDPRQLTPDSKPRTRAPATKKKEGPSADAWYEVADVCPPISSLDASNMSLMLPEWKASNSVRPLDLSKDPDLKHLDRREVDLASALRLPCNMYLLCKRSIFIAKLAWLKDAKEGKEVKGEFNKTAAQNVCTIDVNKVSKLWTAFNRVGWFDEHWFQQYL